MEEKILCLVCRAPSAIFYKDEKTGHTYRLAKTMRRITAPKYALDAEYVHESPCLAELVKSWAKYVVDGRTQGFLLRSKNNENQQANP